MFRSQKSSVVHKKAFTIVELLVSVGIFALMTTLLMVKYGNFNSSVLLTNTAYDVALTIRTAQTYGLSVRSDSAGSFNKAYGIHFDYSGSDNVSPLSNVPMNQTIVLFADLDADNVYDSGEEVSYFVMNGGAYISGISSLCVTTNLQQTCVANGNQLNIIFKRPDPDALICPVTNGEIVGDCNNVTQVYIVVSNSNGDYRIISVMKNGQISADTSPPGN